MDDKWFKRWFTIIQIISLAWMVFVVCAILFVLYLAYKYVIG